MVEHEQLVEAGKRLADGFWSGYTFQYRPNLKERKVWAKIFKPVMLKYKRTEFIMPRKKKRGMMRRRRRCRN